MKDRHTVCTNSTITVLLFLSFEFSFCTVRSATVTAGTACASANKQERFLEYEVKVLSHCVH